MATEIHIPGQSRCDDVSVSFQAIARHDYQDMIIRRHASFLLTLIGAWGLSTLSGIADDADHCVNAAGREGIAACDRVIASGDVGRRGRAVAYYYRGLARLGTGEHDRAIADFDASIALDPESARTFNNRGTAWYVKGDRDRALADFDKAIQRDPDYAFAWHNRGEVWKDKGDFNRAIADYGKAIGLDPGYTAAYADRALAYERIGDLARAAQDFRTALARPAQYGDGPQAQATARERLAALMRAEPRPATDAIPSPRPPVHDAGGRRIALVIGNSAYAAVPALANPPRDAELLAATLQRSGFEAVKLLSDLVREKFVDALQAFARDARQADWAVVYFAGHGIEIDGINYLVPVDARLETDRDVKLEAISLDQVLAAVEGARKLHLVMLDACRNNPFIAQMRTTTAMRTVRRGLGPLEPASGTLVVYAAKHGQTASDGWNGNSPFAAAVAKNLPMPGIEINKLFRLVRDDVMAATGGSQEPFTYGSLPGREDYYFVSR
jgi:Tfp pilus assembly protein PilF